mmetsp:Transcript_16364/g.20383  ORF Transcript_16364/g.20383 Transcript_16364/m.20383 type:complete len:434 (-) Transcript_16364:159-1460(-)
MAPINTATVLYLIGNAISSLEAFTGSVSTARQSRHVSPMLGIRAQLRVPPAMSSSHKIRDEGPLPLRSSTGGSGKGWKRRNHAIWAVSAVPTERAGSSEDTPKEIKTAPYWQLVTVPLLAVLSASLGLSFSSTISHSLGSLPAVSSSLAALMLSMGLTVTPSELRRAVQSPKLLTLNASCCFLLMPALACAISFLLRCDDPQTIGTILLGSVSGGQASNLFALLAGGDVGLSVICTLSTTLLGIVATPLLASYLLGRTVAVDAAAVLTSAARLVLTPLILGLALGRTLPTQSPFERFVRTKACPKIGVGATLLLVAGGAANAAPSLLGTVVAGRSCGVSSSSSVAQTIAASLLLPIVGGGVALGACRALRIGERAKRTLVVEVLSKSPTLAYVLALRHFGVRAAAVPAAAMVSLAVVGAGVAAVWGSRDVMAL